MKNKVVLDTNALLISIPTKSFYRPIFDALINGTFDLAISNEILSEYAEIIERKANAFVADNICELLLTLKNVHKSDVFFKWNLISSDPDDNKFTDCAIASRSDFIVTNDRHFSDLKEHDFPVVEIIDIDQFLSKVLS